MFGLSRESSDPFELEEEIKSKLSKILGLYEEMEEELKEENGELISEKSNIEYQLQVANEKIEELELKVLWAERDTEVL